MGLIDRTRESLVRVEHGYVRDLGDPAHEPDHVFVASRRVPPPLGAQCVLYNEGFTCIASWHHRGAKKECFVSVVPAHERAARRSS